jgi:hypothetical protein
MSDADKPETSNTTQKGVKSQASAAKGSGKGDDRLRRKPPMIEGVGTDVSAPPASAPEPSASASPSPEQASPPDQVVAGAPPPGMSPADPVPGDAGATVAEEYAPSTVATDTPVAAPATPESPPETAGLNKPDDTLDTTKPDGDHVTVASASSDSTMGVPPSDLSSGDMPTREPAAQDNAARADTAASVAAASSGRQDAAAFAEPPATKRTSAPPPPPQKPSLLVPAAVAGVVGLLFGGLAGAYMGTTGGGSDATQAELLRLRDSVATLTRQQSATVNPADLQGIRQQVQAAEAGLGQRIAALETAPRPAANGTAADVQAALAAVTQRLDATETAVKALRDAPQPTIPDLAPLTQRLEGLDRSVGQLSETLRSTAASQEGLAGRLQGTEQRLGQIEPGLAGVGNQVKAAAAKSDEISAGLAAAGTRLSELTSRLDRVNRDISGIKLGPTLTATQSLLAAAEKGGPFPRELAGLEALGADPAAIAQLKPFADRGAPTARRLADALSPRMALIARHGVPPPPAAPSSVGEWLQGAANALVTSRPVGDAEGNAPAAVAARVEAQLRRGNADAAVAEWQRMPDDVRALAPDFTALAAERVKFSEAIAAIERQALAAARQP